MTGPTTSSVLEPGDPSFFSSQVVEARRFYLDLHPAGDGPLTVVCGGFEACRPDYRVSRSDFPYLCLEFVVEGTGSLRLDRREERLDPGTVFLYGPSVEQQIATDASSPMRKYFVDFVGAEAIDLLGRCGVSVPMIAAVSSIAALEGVFDQLLREGASGSGLSEELCAALVRYLLLKVADARVPIGRQRDRSYHTYRKCRDHIARRFVEIRTLRQAADECNVDPAYLCRLFRRYDQQTPHAFLTRLKMGAAAERLRDTDLLIKQVAAEIGFEDAFQFSRVFRRSFGLSPNAFRQHR